MAQGRTRVLFFSLLLVGICGGQPVLASECPQHWTKVAGKWVRGLFTRGSVATPPATDTASTSTAPHADLAGWFQAPKDGERPLAIAIPKGKSLQDMNIVSAFLEMARRDPDRVLLVDDVRGPITARRIVSAMYFLRPEIRKRVEGDIVGVMLPASVGATLTQLGVQASGKVPAQVNWTVGEHNMRLALDNLGVNKILTSRVFMEEALKRFPYLKAFEDRFVYLDDFKQNPTVTVPGTSWSFELPVTQVKQAVAGLRGYLPWNGLGRDVHDTAVILFTSGSSGIPKAVPISHQNQLANINDLISVVPPQQRDRLVAILPPFHSFGSTGNIALPLVTGLQTVYYPNPLSGKGVADVVDRYQGTAVLATPTFLQMMARASREGQLDTLRFAIHGAEAMNEKAAQAIRENTPEGFQMIGAYGTTEASPAVTSNHMGRQEPGTVGWILPSMEYRIVEENGSGGFRNVAPGEKGRFLIRGPNLFEGYLNYEGKSPFVSHEGKDWYDTGDVFSASPQTGALSIHGRASMDFAKIGGEMVSFQTITDRLHEHFKVTDGNRFVVMEDSRGDKPRLVLFTTQPNVTKEEVNQAITSGGLTNLYGVHRVVSLTEFPQLGTGKMDKKTLKEMANRD